MRWGQQEMRSDRATERRCDAREREAEKEEGIGKGRWPSPPPGVQSLHGRRKAANRGSEAESARRRSQHCGSHREAHLHQR